MNESPFSAVAATFLLLSGCASPQYAAIASESHFVSFGTNRVHYLIEGKGSHTIVFVHCWAGNAGLWREQVPELAGHARLVLVDLPGHGQSDKPHADYTMDFFAGAVLAVMRDAHVDKATLVGHSMGVPVICRMYKQAPEKIAALVAVDGVLRRPKMTSDQAEQFVNRFRADDYREKTRQFMTSMFPVPGTEAIRDRVISEMLETPRHVMLSAMEGMFAADQPDWDLHHA